MDAKDEIIRIFLDAEPEERLRITAFLAEFLKQRETAEQCRPGAA